MDNFTSRTASQCRFVDRSSAQKIGAKESSDQISIAMNDRRVRLRNDNNVYTGGLDLLRER